MKRCLRVGAAAGAAQAVINTQVAAAAATLVWLLAERFTDGHATVLGAVTGAVAGLATITQCAGFGDSYAAIVIGGLAGLICHLLVEAGAVRIVLSEASLFTKAPHTEMFRGQRRVVEFRPRLRLEVTAAESDVPRVVQAIQRILGAGAYLQIIDARLPLAAGGSQTPGT